jgi:hypothetical protein
MTATRSPAATGNTSALSQDNLDFFARPGPMTSPSKHVALLDPLPQDVSALAGLVPGLSIHEYMAAEYGVTIPEDRKRETHIRSLDRMLDRILDLDGRPLAERRPPDMRLVGVCNHFAVLFVGMLRAKGIPARARWGFGSYFNPPFFEDHVLGEYWNAEEARWVRADAQLDEMFRKALKLDFNTLDVPQDRFVIAGDAWVECRAGRADASKYGIFKGDLRGLWFIGCSLVKEVAALNKMELLPWDTWGAMPKPGSTLSADQLRFFDRLAELTRAPDPAFAELRKLYDGDDRVRVPAQVFNSLLNRNEAI